MKARDEDFLIARVSADLKIIGIEHETDADWYQVLEAHIALRDKLQERIDGMGRCPYKPPEQAREAMRVGLAVSAARLAAYGQVHAPTHSGAGSLAGDKDSSR